MENASRDRPGPGLLAPVLAAALLLPPAAAPGADKGPPATPRDAMIQATEGLFKDDEGRLFGAARLNDKQKAFLRAAMRLLRNVYEFRDAFIKAYGEKAWERFIDPKIDPGMGEGNTNLTVVELKDQLAAIEDARMEEKGDEATAVFKDQGGNPVTWKLHKVEGGWLVDGESLTGPADQLEATTKQLAAVADLLKKYQKAIGKRGISGDDIDVELGKAILKELKGFKSDKKPRFNIDDIKE